MYFAGVAARHGELCTPAKPEGTLSVCTQAPPRAVTYKLNETRNVNYSITVAHVPQLHVRFMTEMSGARETGRAGGN